ncbi:hypothetical protein [Candidatus Poriferisodalis sp.]|uniref:hypothetical protein n=1 Tax=Candidatus Poriferisodalis sp. TaxID=3101277 RepID=UPI003B01491D
MDGRKLVGISQRRTREGSRFQCIAYESFGLGPIETVLDSATAIRVHNQAVGWADLGITASPADIAKHMVAYITAHDTE